MTDPIIGEHGRNPSSCETCEEASILSITRYIPCGNKATRQVYHPRDNKTYAMCEGCADHNVRNRGAEYLHPSK